MKLSNNTILITGGSSGIGWALAKCFYQLENKVIITGRDAEKLAQIKGKYPNIETFAQDLTQPQALDDLTTFIKENHPDLNILINNAAVQYNYLFAEERDYTQKIDYELAVNLAVARKSFNPELGKGVLKGFGWGMAGVAVDAGFDIYENSLYDDTLYYFTRVLSEENTKLKGITIIAKTK